jgi:hypothetical protein
MARSRGKDGRDIAVTSEIADGVEQTKPGCRKPKGWQQRTEHYPNPIHHPFDASPSKVFNVVFLHVLVPGEWTARRSHQLLDRVECDIRRALPGASVITHLESLDEQRTPAPAASQGESRPPGPTSPA